MSERRRQLLAGLVTFVVFVAGFAALAARDAQHEAGGSWTQAFLGILGGASLFAAPVFLFIGWSEIRRLPDGMPRSLWADRQVPSGAGEQQFRVSKSYWALYGGFYATCAVAAPFFVYPAVREGKLEVMIFVALWLVGMGAMGVYQLRRTPEVLTLTGDNVLHVDGNRWGRRHWDIPVESIRSVRWPTMGGYVTVVHAGGRMSVPKQVARLDRLVVELRRRNPHIQYQGGWPPQYQGGWPRRGRYG